MSVLIYSLKTRGPLGPRGICKAKGNKGGKKALEREQPPAHGGKSPRGLGVLEVFGKVGGEGKAIQVGPELFFWGGESSKKKSLREGPCKKGGDHKQK